MLPAIGSLSALNSGGRLGVVVDARPLAEPADGRQLAALQLRTVDQRDAQGQAAARVSGLAPLPAEATERPGASRRTLAPRDERAAAALARLSERRSELASDPAPPIADAPCVGPTAGRMRRTARSTSGPLPPGAMQSCSGSAPVLRRRPRRPISRPGTSPLPASATGSMRGPEQAGAGDAGSERLIRPDPRGSRRPDLLSGSKPRGLRLGRRLARALCGWLLSIKSTDRVDLPFLVGSAFFLALVPWSGVVSRSEGVLSLCGLGLYVWYSLAGKVPIERKLDGRESALAAEPRWLRSTLVLLGAAGLIYLGADWTVEAVVRISGLVGIGAEVIAASAVALGTSLPEVAVTVAAARRGRPEIAIGNVLGSNVFNAFAVIGASALVGPLVVPPSIVNFGLPVMIIATLLAFFMIMEKEMTKWEVWLALLLYVYFLGALFDLL